MWRKVWYLFLAIALTMTPPLLIGCSEESPTSMSSGESSEIQPQPTRLLPDPREAVVAECLLAVMGWDWDVDRQVGGNAAGDWNYLADDLNAYAVLKGWYGGNCSLWDPPKPSYYTNPTGYGFYQSYGRGGQCPHFANLILYRSGVWQHQLHSYAACLADYNRGPGRRQFTKPASESRIGDVIRTFDSDSPGCHTAIVVKLMAGGYGTPVTSVDIVDSNFIGDEMIGRHVISRSGSGVNDLDNYYAIDLIALGGR